MKNQIQRLLVLADSLDSKGLYREADELDRIVTAQLRYKVTMACLVEAGLKDDFLNIVKKGKENLIKILKDTGEATLKEIKTLTSVDAVKNFLAKNPALKGAVLAAIALGVLAFPVDAKAEILNTNAPDSQVVSVQKEDMQFGIRVENGKWATQEKLNPQEEALFQLVNGSPSSSRHFPQIWNSKTKYMAEGLEKGFFKDMNSFREFHKKAKEILKQKTGMDLDNAWQKARDDMSKESSAALDKVYEEMAKIVFQS